LKLFGRDQFLFEEELAYSNGHELSTLLTIDKMCQ
jgi:hypothetical protein